jgi:hypothetical protein
MTPPNAVPNGQCFCRCGLPASPGRFFAQGHDRRAATILDSITNNRPIIDRLVVEGYHFGPDGLDLREAALASGKGWEACTEPGCRVYGRGIGLRRHIAEAH